MTETESIEPQREKCNRCRVKVEASGYSTKPNGERYKSCEKCRSSLKNWRTSSRAKKKQNEPETATIPDTEPVQEQPPNDEHQS